MSDLFGRETERNAIRSLWGERDEPARLITLHGPLGVGKSALLDRFAREVPSAIRVNLSLARTESDILTLVARALGHEDADEPWIIEALTERGAVLVFDPAEHVRTHLAAIVARWLDQIETVRFLVATREPIDLPGEALLPIAPLSPAAAAELFVAEMHEPAALSGRDMQRVSSIVDRLEYLPLSIVLAARRTALLSLGELEQRLSVPLQVLKDSSGSPSATHASLRAAIAWSWNHLTEDERELLRRASVAPFGFRFSVAEKMLDDTERALDAMDGLARKSLLLAAGSGETRRFHTMAPIRAFAIETVEEVTLADYERSFAEATVRSNEHANDGADRDSLLHIAERYATSEPPLAARALLGAHPTALYRGPFDSYATLLRRTLSALGERSPLVAASIECALGELLRERGDLENAELHLRSAVQQIANQTGREETSVLADATRLLSLLSRMKGDVIAAAEQNHAALRLYKELEDEDRVARTLIDRGAIELAANSLKKALESHKQAVDIHRRSKNVRGLATALSYLGIATHRLGRLNEALPIHEEAKAIHEDLGHTRLFAAECSHLGYTHHELGGLTQAEAYFDESIRHARVAQDSLLLTVALLYSARVDIEQRAFERASAKIESALAGAREMKHARLAATAHAHLGHIALSTGQVTLARDLYTNAISLSEASEVGVEHLTHGYLGYAHHLLGDNESAAKCIERCIALTANHESPPIGEAARLLESLVNGEAAPKSRAASSEVRRILSLFGPGEGALEIRVEGDGAAIQIGDIVHNMKRKGALRRIFMVLAAHHAERKSTALTWQELAAAGWPGEKMRTEAAIKRVYTAVWALRKMGLGEHLVTRDDGYFFTEALKIKSSEKL